MKLLFETYCMFTWKSTDGAEKLHQNKLNPE